MTTTRAKFRIDAITKRKHWNKDQGDFLYDLEASPVTGDSEENKRFFASTPSGSIKLGTVNENAVKGFEPGRYVYVTLELADE